MSAHATLGASSAHRWMECPGSVRLSALAPPEKSGPYAAEGTAAHALAERCLRERAPAAAYLGREVSVFEADEDAASATQVRFDHVKPEDAAKLGTQLANFKIAEEMAAAVQVYLDYVWSRVHQLEALYDQVTVHFERRLDLSFVRAGLWGTGDCVLDARSADRLRGEIEAIDYKHGKGIIVEAEGNPQTTYYGLGALGPPLNLAKGLEDVTVRLTIVQPRAGTPAVRSAVTSAVELRAWGVEKLGPAADATKDENAPLKAGEKQCRFCAAKATCPALRDFVQSQAELDFSDVPAVTIGAGKAVDAATVKKGAQSADSALLARVIEAAPLIEIWLSACQAEAQARALRGEKIPGHKLVESRTFRRWRDQSNAAAALKKLGVHAFKVPELIGIPEAEEQHKAAAEAMELKRKTPEWDAHWAKLYELVEKPAGLPTLVPESDKREPWQSPEEAFAALPPCGDLQCGGCDTCEALGGGVVVTKAGGLPGPIVEDVLYGDPRHCGKPGCIETRLVNVDDVGSLCGDPRCGGCDTCEALGRPAPAAIEALRPRPIVGEPVNPGQLRLLAPGEASSGVVVIDHTKHGPQGGDPMGGPLTTEAAPEKKPRRPRKPKAPKVEDMLA